MNNQSIFRRAIKDKHNPYVMINKSMVQDDEISWKAKGILMYLLSLPDDWQIYEQELVRNAADGKASLKSGLQELIDHGYIQRTRKRNSKGHFKGYEYLVYEVKPDNQAILSRSRLSDIGETDIGKTDIGKSDTTNNKDTNNELTNNSNSSSKGENNFKEITSLFEENGFGLITQYTAEQLIVLNDEYGFDWLKEAIEIAVKANSRNLRYVEGILKNWKSKGKGVQGDGYRGTYKESDDEDEYELPAWIYGD